MKRICGILVILSLWFVAPGFAAEVTVLNKAFVRGSAEPAPQRVVFPGVAGTATIRLVNGSLADSSLEKVSSSTITLNGRVIFGPADFSQTVSSLEKEITLADYENTLEVLLKGKPGGSVTLQIVQSVEKEAQRDLTAYGAGIAFKSNNIEGALEHFAPSLRERYREIFQSFAPSTLRQLGQDIENAELVKTEGNLATYRVNLYSHEASDFIDVDFVLFYEDSAWKFICF